MPVTLRRLASPALMLSLASLTAPFEAQAHQFQHPKILRLGVKRDRLILSLSYDINPGEDSKRMRSLFDRDANGALDDAEQQRLARYLEETATLWMKMTIDGEAAKLERVQVVPNRLVAPGESTDSLGIAILYEIPLPKSATVAIELFDRDKDRMRHVPLTIDLGADWRVAFSSQGELYPKSRQIQRVLLKEDAPLLLRLRRIER